MVKLTDVARAAGVGYGTASRALSGKGPVGGDARTRVLQAARELGYVTDGTARALREGRTRSVGLIVPDMTNEFYTASAEVLQDVLRTAGHHLFVATTGNHPGLDQEALQAMAARRVDGIVHVPSGPAAAHQSPVPVVELNRYSGRQVPAVVSDDINGVKQLTELAVTAGYTDIAAIVGPETYSTSRDRLAGFKAAAEAAGFEDSPTAAKRFRIISSDFSVAGGSEAMTTLLTKPPQAVLPLSSRLVMGVLKTARAHGIRFPDDMALAGYGDPDWFEIWGPGITTFAPPLSEMGAKAAETLLDLINSEDIDPSINRLPGTIKQRGTM
ncbi:MULTISPECIES: LacI family DNA-binding transcriptional regulator [Paenarthrobacter]|uniref:LacI family transcriptional regulator n=1 Tax=Paenarthrobacter ureafaciens TaxID=37931 RepID=A0AAX3EPD9_PAEUR|nr:MULTISPECIES: LacI family DNA-binding transcriptional regulator [Paenarthrobacter]NKR09883.1 LacI family transcriptional regulator [Arthrobacter sp. M5]NKR16698.1 LacI family transcriptional regulator [Arthrobacter sp. M6]MCW3767297.1 LacI family transcriptional regulator [Paenarthrobacter sp. PAE-2]MDO5866974.1 LacI family transcriptional regulator [Paenarthrobacter sp. SD-2]MDO5878085.1 LacI family transcriptional regulator [Paenarthrobacter sp. SD-1]